MDHAHRFHGTLKFIKDGEEKDIELCGCHKKDALITKHRNTKLGFVSWLKRLLPVVLVLLAGRARGRTAPFRFNRSRRPSST